MYLKNKLVNKTKQAKNITNKTTTKTDRHTVFKYGLSLLFDTGSSPPPGDYVYIWTNVIDISNIKKNPDSFKPLRSD